MKSTFPLLIVLLLGFLASSCSKDSDPQPVKTSLEIRVNNGAGAGISNITVTLYKTEKDWQEEQNPVKSAQVTDASGKVVFIDLEPITYYIDAVGANMNNWESVITSSLVRGKTTPVTTTVTETKSGMLASAAGKRWKYVSIKVDGEEYINEPDLSCYTDDINTFYKGGKEVLDENKEKCDPVDPQTLMGSWSLSTDGKTLFITSDGTTDAYEIVSMSATTLKTRYQEDDGQIVEFTFMAL